MRTDVLTTYRVPRRSPRLSLSTREKLITITRLKVDTDICQRYVLTASPPGTRRFQDNKLVNFVHIIITLRVNHSNYVHTGVAEEPIVLCFSPRQEGVSMTAKNHVMTLDVRWANLT